MFLWSTGHFEDSGNIATGVVDLRTVGNPVLQQQQDSTRQVPDENDSSAESFAHP